jgi:hypothetical protein
MDLGYHAKPDALTIYLRISVGPMSLGRKENWSVSETAALIDVVSVRYEIIKGKLSSFLTLEKKAQAWEEIQQT